MFVLIIILSVYFNRIVIQLLPMFTTVYNYYMVLYIRGF